MRAAVSLTNRLLSSGAMLTFSSRLGAARIAARHCSVSLSWNAPVRASIARASGDVGWLLARTLFEQQRNGLPTTPYLV